MSILAGKWTGQISGTNVGSFVLDLQSEGSVLRGNFALQDFDLGLFEFDASGEVNENHITLTLIPRIFPDGAEVGIVQAEGVIQQDGSLSGEWHSRIGTKGNFIGSKQSHSTPTPSQSAQPSVAISYQKSRGVIPCAVNSEVLRRVFRDLSAGSDEAARLEIALNAQIGALTGVPSTSSAPEEHTRVRAAYSVMVTARGRTGEREERVSER